MADDAENSAEEVNPDPTVLFLSSLKDVTPDDLEKELAKLQLKPAQVDLVGREANAALVKFHTEAEAADALKKLEGLSINGKPVKAREDRGPTRSRRRARRTDAEPPEPADPNFIFVGNLALGVKAAALTDFFGAHGSVTSSKVIGSWGIVQFSTEEEATAALAADGSELNGRPLKVEKLRNAPRKRTRKPKAVGDQPPKEKKDKKEKKERRSRQPREPREPLVALKFLASATAEFKHVKELFSEYGPIFSLEFRKNDGKGEGLVIFETEEAGEAALAANGIDFKGSKLEITRDESRPKKLGRRRRPRRRNRGTKDKPAGNEAPAEKKPSRKRGKKEKQEQAPKETREKPARAKREKKPPTVREVADPERHLFVGNLAYKVEDKDLANLFAPYGVVEATVAQGRNNRSRGFGAVQLSSVDAARKAIAEVNQKEFHGRPLIVRLDSFVKSA